MEKFRKMKEEMGNKIDKFKEEREANKLKE
jgi:hypothetical protein